MTIDEPNPALEADAEGAMPPLGDGDVFDPAAHLAGAKPRAKAPPAYRIYDGSRVAISKAHGNAWKGKYNAAKRTYSELYKVWEEVFKYFNAHQNVTLETQRGSFRRGDGTENVVYANINVMLNATYSRNPDIECNTVVGEQEPFCDALKAVIKTLFDRRDKIHLKPKAKRAVGFALLTNSGILKLDYQGKDDSREVMLETLTEITTKLRAAKDSAEVSELYGQLEALEAQMEVAKPSGFSSSNVLPSNLIIDPYYEQTDGSDANWMMEEVFFNTSYLKARFTMKDEDGADVLVYKPTHKVSLTDSANARDDGLGMVLVSIGGNTDQPTAYTEEERLSYLYTYMTKCVYVWDKTTRRVYLYLQDDWSWPIWVWDDPLKLTRFFPYFIMAFGMNTGRGASVGETGFYLDQQDEINDINRQRNRIRRSVFDYFFYNTNKINQDVAEQLVRAIRGETSTAKHAVGVNLEEGQKVADAFEALLPPSADYEQLFDKTPATNAMDRVSNSNDALRGSQFKTNTNVPAVETYQQAAKLSVDAKVDPIEDTLSDFALAVAELCVTHMSQADVADLVGAKLAEGWVEMDLATFTAKYNLNIVAGTTEKQNSAFKKKEAIQIAQALGQFARAAPGAVMSIMLKVFEKAFTDVVISPEDWDVLKQEVQASIQKGISTGGAPGEGQAEQGGGAAGIDELLAKVPPEVKEKAVQALQSGAPPEQIIQMLTQAAGTASQPQGMH